MEKILSLLKDGNARTITQLAIELGTDTDDIKRKLEYLENMKVIRRISLRMSGCNSCSGCSVKGHPNAAPCKGCIPEKGFLNMGEMWEVV